LGVKLEPFAVGPGEEVRFPNRDSVLKNMLL
jgi:hypothetical protein